MLRLADVYAAQEQLVRESIASYDPLAMMTTGAKYARALDAKDRKGRATQKRLLIEVVKEQLEFKLAQFDLLTLGD